MTLVNNYATFKASKSPIITYLYNLTTSPMQARLQYHSQPTTAPTKPQQQQSQFVTTYASIIQSLEIRSDLMASILQKQEPDKFLDAGSKYRIVNHCNQYSKIVPLVGNLLTGGKDSGIFVEHQKFWQINENLERQLEAQLRELKNVDLAIDNIVNQEFDRCNQIDEIEETIRIILSKKDANHISKAEPYYQEKQRSMAFLSEKKQEKEKIKQEKLSLVKKILSLLDTLKRHRQSGLKMCMIDEKERKNMENQQILLQRVINDFKQIQKNEGELASMSSQIGDFSNFISETQKKIDKYSKQLLNLMEQQNEACLQLESIIKLKSETEYFENSLLAMFGIKRKRDLGADLHNTITKLQRFSKQNKQKQKQSAKIEQGIETTKKTIGIFEHIMNKIETQNLRKKQLLKDIEKIQLRHSQQDKALSSIYDIENEAQKLILKKNQLNKNLESKMNEANVAAYKSIHEEIIRVESEIKNKQRQIDSMKQNASENARLLYDETMGLQQTYEDILSEVVPSIWLKESDFTKEESIKDLNLYLLKTFKRLSIAD